MKALLRNQPLPRTNRGTVLLVAIVFAAVSAVTVGSFIKLAHHELRMSNIQFYSNESVNLAEAGLEEALHALNYHLWQDWQRSGDEARYSARDLNLGRGATGEFHALIENRSTDPVVTAEGKVTSASGLTSTRQIRITLRKRTYFANGITSRYTITFSGGNAHVDSYFSSEGPFSSTRRRDRGNVASVSVETDAIELGNGHIWGYVFTGGEWPDVRNGSIRGEDTPSDISIDTNRIARDFSAEFPFPKDPPPHTVYYEKINSGMSLGTPGATEPTVIKVGSIKMQDDLQIQGPVILIVEGNASFSGSGGLTVQDEPNARLRVYINGDFSISGKGMGNETRIPENLVIFGMNDTHQSFDLGGNARWEAAVYAPNANLKLNGGGNDGHMSGAVVGKNVTINGGSKFHYDENLADFTDAFGFALDDWQELTRAEDRIVFY